MSFIFRPPALGKPDPYVPNVLESPQKRVRQLPQKGKTCWYYAPKTIGLRIGKCPLPSQEKERKSEILFSKYRKQLTAVDNKNIWQVLLIQNLYAAVLTKESPHFSREIAVRALQRGVVHQLVTPQYQAWFTHIVQQFCLQTEEDDLLRFVKKTVLQEQKNEMLEIYKNLLKQLQIPYLERHALFCQMPEWMKGTGLEEKWHAPAWEKVSLEKKIDFVSNLAFQAYCESLNLQHSSWVPRRGPIQWLHYELSEHGPLIVSGYLGRSFYTVEPRQLAESMEGRPVFRWDPGTRHQMTFSAHVIILVGVDCLKRLVYYIDPTDGSDPANLESQLIYEIPYEELEDYVQPFAANWTGKIDLSRGNYAMYG